MNVLQLSPHDYQGGASRIAWYLFNGYKQRGLNSVLAVGRKSLDDQHILPIDQTKHQGFVPAWKMLKWFHIFLGWENFNFPATPHIPDMLPFQPDIVHAHNLQGKYFDLRFLPALSAQYPMVLTLHDTWMLSGHCAYAVGCERWKTGCGQCPDLNAGPAVYRDATAFNWRRKKEIYQRAKVYIATPSQWLMDQVKQSMLMPAVLTAKVIPNGVDTTIYHPTDKHRVRQELDLPEDAFVLLYVVASGLRKSSYKDFSTIEQALVMLQQRVGAEKKVIFLGLGGNAGVQKTGNIEKRFIPYIKDSRQLAKYNQAADVLLHAARADTFPNVVLEALACGTVVIATAVGGVPEQIIDGQTGYLVPAQDPEAMCQKVIDSLQDEEKRVNMSFAATKDVQHRFLLSRMIDDYLTYYREIMENFAGTGRKKDIDA